MDNTILEAEQADNTTNEVAHQDIKEVTTSNSKSKVVEIIENSIHDEFPTIEVESSPLSKSSENEFTTDELEQIQMGGAGHGQVECASDDWELNNRRDTDDRLEDEEMDNNEACVIVHESVVDLENKEETESSHVGHDKSTIVRSGEENLHNVQTDEDLKERIKEAMSESSTATILKPSQITSVEINHTGGVSHEETRLVESSEMLLDEDGVDNFSCEIVELDILEAQIMEDSTVMDDVAFKTDFLDSLSMASFKDHEMIIIDDGGDVSEALVETTISFINNTEDKGEIILIEGESQILIDISGNEISPNHKGDVLPEVGIIAVVAVGDTKAKCDGGDTKSSSSIIVDRVEIGPSNSVQVVEILKVDDGFVDEGDQIPIDVRDGIEIIINEEDMHASDVEIAVEEEYTTRLETEGDAESVTPTVLDATLSTPVSFINELMSEKISETGKNGQDEFVSSIEIGEKDKKQIIESEEIRSQSFILVDTIESHQVDSIEGDKIIVVVKDELDGSILGGETARKEQYVEAEDDVELSTDVVESNLLTLVDGYVIESDAVEQVEYLNSYHVFSHDTDGTVNTKSERQLERIEDVQVLELEGQVNISSTLEVTGKDPLILALAEKVEKEHVIKAYSGLPILEATEIRSHSLDKGIECRDEEINLVEDVDTILEERTTSISTIDLEQMVSVKCSNESISQIEFDLWSIKVDPSTEEQDGTTEASKIRGTSFHSSLDIIEGEDTIMQVESSSLSKSETREQIEGIDVDTSTTNTIMDGVHMSLPISDKDSRALRNEQDNHVTNLDMEVEPFARADEEVHTASFIDPEGARRSLLVSENNLVKGEENREIDELDHNSGMNEVSALPDVSGEKQMPILHRVAHETEDLGIPVTTTSSAADSNPKSTIKMTPDEGDISDVKFPLSIITWCSQLSSLFGKARSP